MDAYSCHQKGNTQVRITVANFERTFNPRMCKQSHTPSTIQGGGGWMEPLPGVFVLLIYFEDLSLSVDNLLHFLEDRTILGGVLAT